MYGTNHPQPRSMTPLEILYACPEIMGNHDQNHWKSGNQASHQKSQFAVKCFLNLKYIPNAHEILKDIYKYNLISLNNNHLLTCNDSVSFLYWVNFKTSNAVYKSIKRLIKQY